MADVIVPLGHTLLDGEREKRTGLPEAIYGAGKTLSELESIVASHLERRRNLLVTRLDEAKGRALSRRFEGLRFQSRAGLAWRRFEAPVKAPKPVALLSAGTSDRGVFLETLFTLLFLGHDVLRANDVGVAGLHRILSKREMLAKASVVIVVAGMDGALPSVTAGLVNVPVIAVPTSQGYGASFEGIGPLLAMLSSCAPGVGVVNIDNGFGAACLAAQINRQIR